MIGRTNTGGGGGGGLNFSVVGGTTAPSNPKENMIWVNTSVAITTWVFSATVPENPVQGMVWISTGTSSTVAFNALKKNGIQVYPISAKQCVSGAWVDKAAKSYQNGAWKDVIQAIFRDGKLNGISGFNAARASVAVGSVLTFTSDTNVFALCYSKETIDVTNVSTIKIVFDPGSWSYEVASAPCPLIGVSKSVPSQNSSSGQVSGLVSSNYFGTLGTPGGTLDIVGEYKLDISSVTGEVYLVFSWGSTTGKTAPLIIREITLH
jgi:hypothetical protein